MRRGSVGPAPGTKADRSRSRASRAGMLASPGPWRGARAAATLDRRPADGDRDEAGWDARPSGDAPAEVPRHGREAREAVYPSAVPRRADVERLRAVSADFVERVASGPGRKAWPPRHQANVVRQCGRQLVLGTDRRAQFECHVRLSGAQVDVADQHVVTSRRALARAHEQRLAVTPDGLCGEHRAKAPPIVCSRRSARVAERHVDQSSWIGGPGDRHWDVARQDHVRREERVEYRRSDRELRPGGAAHQCGDQEPGHVLPHGGHHPTSARCVTAGARVR